MFLVRGGQFKFSKIIVTTAVFVSVLRDDQQWYFRLYGHD